MLPNPFNKQYYGIVLPMNSEVRNEINHIILEYLKTDEWQDLVQEYEGE